MSDLPVWLALSSKRPAARVFLTFLVQPAVDLIVEAHRGLGEDFRGHRLADLGIRQSVVLDVVEGAASDEYLLVQGVFRWVVSGWIIA